MRWKCHLLISFFLFLQTLKALRLSDVSAISVIILICYGVFVDRGVVGGLCRRNLCVIDILLSQLGVGTNDLTGEPP